MQSFNEMLKEQNAIKAQSAIKAPISASAEQSFFAQKKSALRKEFRAQINNLPFEYTYGASAAICEKLLNLNEYLTAKTVFCYVGTNREIQTTIFIQNVLKTQKILCVPLCVQSEAQQNVGKNVEMVAKKLINMSQLSMGSYSIEEPPMHAITVDPREIDVVIMPCMAADKTGARLGYGKGFYDRYLARTREDCKKIIICRHKMLKQPGVIPMEGHDVFANMVVTEEETFNVS